MAVYFVTGKLGNGKTLVAVSRIKMKLDKGLPVATNIDLNLLKMYGPKQRKLNVIRVPDKPTVADLEALGNANPTYDEAQNGLLVLDECGTWFNSRSWADKARGPVNDWFLHARKLGWDVLLIVQDISIIDKQARECLAEHTVFCKRLDNLHVPFFGTVWKAITGYKMRLPRVHMGRVVYGDNEQALLSDRWVYRGTELFSAYDTKQLFLRDYPHGTHSVLTPWHLVGRHLRKKTPRERMAQHTRIIWKRYSRPLVAAVGMVVGGTAVAAALSGRENLAGPVPPVQPETLIAGPQTTTVIDDEPYQEPLSELLDGYWLAGSVRKSTDAELRTFYIFKHASKPYLSSAHTQLADVRYSPMNACLVRVTRGTESVVVGCRDL